MPPSQPLSPRPAFRLAAFLALMCFCALALPARGAPQYGFAGGSSVRVIGNDNGGRLKPRFAEIRALRSRGERVEIRGRYCLSACTLYLGAGNVCVDPDTRFGFHGPGYPSQPIRRERFEYWSQRMATYYPPGVQGWFLSRARYVTSGYLTLMGADLIRMGVSRCRDS
ncbi:conserved hypothetical protein [Citreicella sp. SE45]|nr:conserved hypothetical protein [Citreicella sp. SE45]